MDGSLPFGDIKGPGKLEHCSARTNESQHNKKSSLTGYISYLSINNNALLLNVGSCDAFVFQRILIETPAISCMGVEVVVLRQQLAVYTLSYCSVCQNFQFPRYELLWCVWIKASFMYMILLFHSLRTLKRMSDISDTVTIYKR